MSKYILCCSCYSMGKKAAEAFSILFPNEVLPEIIKGKDRISKFAATIDNKHLQAIAKLSGRFAYYVDIDGNNIVMEYDLVRRTRLR